MKPSAFFDNVLELIRRTSTVLPPDVTSVLDLHAALETPGTSADLALKLVAENIALARGRSAPICQDTGTISFYVKTPPGFDQIEFEETCNAAVVEATKLGYLRQNSVDSVTGHNSGNNLGPGSPVYHWHQHGGATIDVRLILKGGGCENMSAQYSLPATISGKRADRDFDGVFACVIDAVWQAQGKGCGPGFLGVCIGGDRASGYDFAKHQLLRTCDDTNPDPTLAELEARVMNAANQLNIGPMGFGGKLTVGACKIGAINRLPASFFLTVAYMCWAYRRRGVVLDAKSGEVRDWLYQAPGEFDKPFEEPADKGLVELGSKGGSTARIVKLKTPLTEADVRGLKAGDIVLLSGVVFTGRDAVHQYLHKGGDLDVLHNSVIYHCGPVVLEERVPATDLGLPNQDTAAAATQDTEPMKLNGAQERYKVVAAGPTTSIREEPYQAEVIKRFGVKAVIGKGGMGAKTLAACKEYGCVYLHAIGGAAQIYARCVEKVPNVYLKQFGSPEAVWEMHVKDFPAVVTMDAHGRSLHAEVADDSKARLAGVA